MLLIFKCRGDGNCSLTDCCECIIAIIIAIVIVIVVLCLLAGVAVGIYYAVKLLT